MLRYGALLLCLLGCASAPSRKPTSTPATATTPIMVAPSDPAIRYGGLFDRRVPDAPRFAWPGTHLELQFSGTSLQARLSSTPADRSSDIADWITVVVDDGEPKALALAEGEHVYQLALGLAPGRHRALIWKRTESALGTITLHGFVLDPGAEAGPPLPPPARRMFFIGDSITAGYGADGADASCPRSVETDNSYATYGAVAARALGAEYVASAWSGIAIHHGIDALRVPAMPELYKRIMPSEADSPLAPPFASDVVVVNLGTNDFGAGIPDRAKVMAAFEGLLDELRARHEAALIVLMLGPMLVDDHAGPRRTTLRAWLTELKDARDARGDRNLELLEVWTGADEGFGCDYHPSARTHARIGAELAALVRAKLKW